MWLSSTFGSIQVTVPLMRELTYPDGLRSRRHRSIRKFLIAATTKPRPRQSTAMSTIQRARLPCAILLSSQKPAKRHFRGARGSRQRDHCHIERVEDLNIVVVCRRYRFIGLNNFESVRNAISEAIARLGKSSFGRRLVAKGNLNTRIRRGQIEPRDAYVIGDAAFLRSAYLAWRRARSA
jgi:hypothetical protein